MNESKGFSKIILVVSGVVIFIIIGLAVIGYFAQDDTSIWKTYRNEEYGFEVKYDLSLSPGESKYRTSSNPDIPDNPELFVFDSTRPFVQTLSRLLSQMLINHVVT